MWNIVNKALTTVIIRNILIINTGYHSYAVCFGKTQYNGKPKKPQ